MTLDSGTYRTHRKAFVLEEDTLRRIEGLLGKHVLDYEKPLELVYHVEREDDRFYETHTLIDVLADPNAPTKRIDLLGITLRTISDKNDEPRSILRLVFDKEESRDFSRQVVTLRISSPNRTWALLVADEIEPQIQRAFKARYTPRWLLSLLFVPVMAGVYQLNRIIDADKFTPSKSVLFIVLLSIILVIIVLLITLMTRITGTPYWFRRWFGPESAFLWGSELEEYREREQVRKNLLWVVIIGFFVSFSASIASLWF